MGLYFFLCLALLPFLSSITSAEIKKETLLSGISDFSRQSQSWESAKKLVYFIFNS